MTENGLKILAQQLSKPEGEIRKDVAKMMNETNISMTKETIIALHLTDNDKVLVLGHGSAGHLSYLLDFAENVNYTGLEISETMKSEAESINPKHLLKPNSNCTMGTRFLLRTKDLTK